jgi:hypothetical protein
MPSGRPPEGVKHVDRLAGPELGKERLRVMLATLTGELSLAEACARLELSETRFLQLRRRALAAAVAALERGPSGRPAQEPAPEAERVAELEQEVKELKHRLVLEEVRTEMALVMPHLVKKGLAADVKKKPGRRKKKARRGRR